MGYYILPRDDSSDTNYWQYIPNFGGAVFFAVVFGLITIATVFQSIWYRAGYMWVLAMGTACKSESQLALICRDGNRVYISSRRTF